ncbi:MAG: Transketolase [Actinobacteria bacterium ADurb.Bin346]|nr:MAG: Transketolase [Actinobacteria bacterium ADurb.Bin346]
MDNNQKHMLQDTAMKIRIDIIEMLSISGSGHPGGSLSMSDIFSYLYFSGKLKLDASNPSMKDRDRVVLSKGHVCPVLYAALAEKGYFDKSHLKTLRKYGSILQGHPDMNKTPGVDMTSGSLGQGLSCAVGMALGARLDGLACNIFAILGDGECDEGQIWEAAMAAAHYRLGNLIAILDKNDLQIDGYTKDIMNTAPLTDKWKSFGWHVIEIDGHDFDEIDFAVSSALAIKDMPVCIIAKTVKGKGISFMEDRCEWHGKTPSPEETEKAVHELCGIDPD